MSGNLQYISSVPLTNGSLYTVALDDVGVLWSELVVSPSHILTPISTNIFPSSYAQGTTLDDVFYFCTSNLVNGTDIPRQYNPNPSNGLPYILDRVSQVGPGAPPAFQATIASSGSQATITSWAGAGSVVTFQAVNSFTAGEVVILSGFVTSTFFNNKPFSVLGTGLSGTQFEISFSGYSGGTDTGLATPQFGYVISSITQNITGSVGFNNQDMLWSSGPGQSTPGTVLTFYYGGPNAPENVGLVNAINTGISVYVYIANAPNGNGTQIVTGHGTSTPPGAGAPRPFFTSFATVSQYVQTPNPGTWQVTLATLTTQLAIPTLEIGNQIVITGESPSGWNSTWTIVNALLSGTYNIVGTKMTAGTGFYYYQWAGTGPAITPQVGQLVTVIQTTNGNGIFNVVDAAISALGSDSNGAFFNISSFPNQNIPFVIETGQAQTAGTQFQFDPGQTTLGTQTNPIYGNGGAGGVVTITGANAAVGAGTRQAVVFFETQNGFKTPCSSPVTFTTNTAANYIVASNIPLGPPNVIRRWLAFTVAGQNGIPGPNFYTIDTPVNYTINNQTYKYTATYIDDNVTTTAQFTFTDAVLQAGEEIDVQGNNLFAQIELGSSAWCIAYAQRMFYGLEQNKVLNFNNLSFDGGYLPTSTGLAITPAGWSVDPGSNANSGIGATITAFQIVISNQRGHIGQEVIFTANNSFISGEQVTISGLSIGTYLNGLTLAVFSSNGTSFTCLYSAHAVTSPTTDSGTATPLVFGATLTVSQVFGDAYYINNQTGSTQTSLGMILQSAFQDAYNVPIIRPSTTYSVRICAWCPSGKTSGTLVIDLTEFDQGLVSGSQTVNAYGATYGSFTLPFANMTTSPAIYTGTLLTVPFLTGVPKGLVLRVWAQNIAYQNDVMIDRIEVFPTAQPLLATNLRVSYPDNFEAFDGVTGNLGLASHNNQPCYGGAIMHDQLFLLQQSSMQSTQDVPGVEPSGEGGGWPVHEVSNRVGACGIHAYDYGEEWILTACRNGVYGFNGGQPIRLDFQQKEIWEAINWDAGHAIVVRNSPINRHFYVAIPLPTPNKWLPLAPSNPVPTVPNVVMMFNYQGLEDFQELVSGKALHTTMFGTLAAVDMKLKCSLWNITTPYMGYVTEADGLTPQLTVCNGVGNQKIYTFSASQLSDDGASINSTYFTYGFVNSAKASQNPLLGFHRKLYQMVQSNIYGSGSATITAYPNYILQNNLTFNPYAYTVPSFPLQLNPIDDITHPLMIDGNRVFLSYSTNAVGAAFTLSKTILVGIIHPYSTINPNA